MRVPPKIKIIPWKACRDGLSTFLILFNKQVPLENKCTFYHLPNKDVNQELFLCLALKDWWLKYLLSLANYNARENFVEIATWVSEHRTTNDLATFFCIKWGLWG